MCMRVSVCVCVCVCMCVKKEGWRSMSKVVSTFPNSTTNSQHDTHRSKIRVINACSEQRGMGGRKKKEEKLINYLKMCFQKKILLHLVNLFLL